MSILIKDMEMPKSCTDCRFHKSIYCTLTDICTNTAQRCPLVPVPPHGRLIDADAIAHDLDDDIENDQRVLDEMDFVGKERDRVQFDKDCKQNCLWYLSEAPTIIESEGE